MGAKLPRYIVWSTDSIDVNDPFQRRWLLRQTLLYGRAEDIRQLDFEEIRHELDELHLPLDLDSLWRSYFRARDDRNSRIST